MGTYKRKQTAHGMNGRLMEENASQKARLGEEKKKRRLSNRRNKQYRFKRQLKGWKAEDKGVRSDTVSCKQAVQNFTVFKKKAKFAIR